MELDNSRIWLYELSAALFGCFLNDTKNDKLISEYDIAHEAKVLFFFEPDIMTNTVKIKVRLDDIFTVTRVDDWLNSRCSFLGEGNCLIDLQDDFGYHHCLYEYNAVCTEFLEAVASYLRITEGSSFTNAAHTLLSNTKAGERLRLKLRKELVQHKATPRTFSFGYEDFGSKILYYRDEDDAKRGKEVLDRYASYTNLDKCNGKLYRYKLEFKIARDTLLSMFFENDSLLKDLKQTI